MTLLDTATRIRRMALRTAATRIRRTTPHAGRMAARIAIRTASDRHTPHARAA
jgi:4'-phosphopantetheinyl transferase EntD